MKKYLVASALLVSSSAFATAPGSETCGWGNMLFEGQSGLPSHVLAMTTNGSTGNNTFGMTFGTNGCSTSGTLTYGGKSIANISLIMDEFTEDVARGEGEALTAMAVSLGVKAEDRALFKATLHDNFDVMFPSEEANAEQVVAAMFAVMQSNETLVKYTV